MKTRFELEQSILNTWNITSDIKLISNHPRIDYDTKVNLEALVTIYELKFNELWNTFEELVKDKQI
jgi:hypothetical protein